MISFSPFEPHHIDEMDVKDIYPDVSELKDNTVLVAQTSGAHVVTLFDALRPISVVGLYPLFAKTCEVFAVTSNSVRSVPLAFHKTVLFLIRNYMEILQLTRVQMVVRESYEEGQRWAKALGFEKEGLLRKYGHNGENYIMFARFG